MKFYNSFDDEVSSLISELEIKLKKNDEQNLGKDKGCDGIHTFEFQRIWKEFNDKRLKAAKKWGVELKSL